MRRLTLLLTAFVFSFVACEKDFETESFTEKEKNVFQKTEYDPNVNPFSLQNMQEAFLILQRESRLNPEQFPDFSIRTTHLYMKFQPKTEVEEGLIKSDSTYFVFDYPLHLPEREEDLYIEQRKPLQEDEDGIQIEFPIYYTAVPVEQVAQLPVKFHVIDELYIPEEDLYFDSVDRDGTLEGEIVSKDDLFENLIYKAYLLTGREQELENEDETSDVTTASMPDNVSTIWFIGKKWNPSGTLKVWDDIKKGYIPLKGAQVLMRQVFTVRQGITDHNGYFRTGSVRGKAKYVLQWERYHYSIRSDRFLQAETDGPRVKNKPWNNSFKGGSAEYYGTIHNAAHMYYYTPRFGFASPPKNGTFKRQMKIAARHKDGDSSHANARSLYFGSQVSIQEWGEGSEKVFGTTIHELTHAAHFDFDKSSYNTLVQKGYIFGSSSTKDGARRLLETWATTAEVYLTNHWYRFVLGINNYSFEGEDLQDRLIYDPNYSDAKYYTAVGIDMMDYLNQSVVYGAGRPVDRVSGYSVSQLQQSLYGATHWSGWKDHIKNQHANATSVYLDELFNNW